MVGQFAHGRSSDPASALKPVRTASQKESDWEASPCVGDAADARSARLSCSLITSLMTW